MRATRVTELRDRFSAKNVADWMGHTAATADKHYSQTTDEHFARAASEPTGYLYYPMQTDADSSCHDATDELAIGEISEKPELCSTCTGDSIVREGLTVLRVFREN